MFQDGEMNTIIAVKDPMKDLGCGDQTLRCGCYGGED